LKRTGDSYEIVGITNSITVIIPKGKGRLKDGDEIVTVNCHISKTQAEYLCEGEEFRVSVS